MDLIIHTAFLPHTDHDASLAFYRDTLGFEVRNDVGYGGMHWTTVGPVDQPGTSLVLFPPGADPGVTDAERRTIAPGIMMRAVAIMRTISIDSTGARPCSGVPSTGTSALIGTDSGCSLWLASVRSSSQRSSIDSPMPMMPPLHT